MSAEAKRPSSGTSSRGVVGDKERRQRHRSASTRQQQQQPQPEIYDVIVWKDASNKKGGLDAVLITGENGVSSTATLRRNRAGGERSHLKSLRHKEPDSISPTIRDVTGSGDKAAADQKYKSRKELREQEAKLQQALRDIVAKETKAQHAHGKVPLTHDKSVKKEEGAKDDKKQRQSTSTSAAAAVVANAAPKTGKKPLKIDGDPLVDEEWVDDDNGDSGDNNDNIDDCDSDDEKKRECRRAPTVLGQLIGYPFGVYPVTLTPALAAFISIYTATITVYVGAAVEPTVVASEKDPCFQVSAWQQQRVNSGGALFAGVVATRDNWATQYFSLPQFPDGLEIGLISDTVLSMDNDGKTVYLVLVYLNTRLVFTPTQGENQGGIAVFTSRDHARTWTYAPAFTSPNFGIFPQPSIPPTYTQATIFPDKPSIAADKYHSGVVRVVFDSFPTGATFHSDGWLAESIDHGAHFLNKLIYNPFTDPTLVSNNNWNDVFVINSQLVQFAPQDLAVAYARTYAVPDATDEEWLNDSLPFPFTQTDIILVPRKPVPFAPFQWSSQAYVAVSNITNANVYTSGYTYSGTNPTPPAITGGTGSLTGGVGVLVRTGSGGGANGSTVFGIALSPKTGALYIAYSSAAFRSDSLQQIGLSWSADRGQTWNAYATYINRTPQTAYNPQAFTPSLAFTPDGFLGVLYSDFRNDVPTGTFPSLTTLTDTWLAVYKEVSPGVLTFVNEYRLSPGGTSFIMQNGPNTSQGLMTVGDYGTVASAGPSEFIVATASSLAGPFAARTIVYEDEASGTVVEADINNRNQVYYSRIRVTAAPPGPCGDCSACPPGAVCVKVSQKCGKCGGDKKHGSKPCSSSPGCGCGSP